LAPALAAGETGSRFAQEISGQEIVVRCRVAGSEESVKSQILAMLGAEMVNQLSVDGNFILKFIGILSIGVVAAIIGFIIMGVLAFRHSSNERAEAFVQLFLRGDALRLLAVAGILSAVLCLAFAKIIDGPTAASILSGMMGFILGGISRSTKSKDDKTGRN
jgi:F0F1-type ATP synthase assembly protein I